MITVHVLRVPGPNAWFWQVLLVGLHPQVPPVVAASVSTKVQANLIKAEIESNLRHPELSPEIYPAQETRFARLLGPEEGADEHEPQDGDDHDQEGNWPYDEPQEQP